MEGEGIDSDNLSNYDLFLLEVDKAIDTGNIEYIKKAIRNYEKYIDISYIKWANFIALQIIEENLENMSM